MSHPLVLWIVLAACCCGAVIALGALHWVIWLAEQQEGGRG